jgi:hypothetical protein
VPLSLAHGHVAVAVKVNDDVDAHVNDDGVSLYVSQAVVLASRTKDR